MDSDIEKKDCEIVFVASKLLHPASSLLLHNAVFVETHIPIRNLVYGTEATMQFEISYVLRKLFDLLFILYTDSWYTLKTW